MTLLGLVLLALTMAALGAVDVLEQRLTWLPVLDLPRVERKVELAAQLSIVLGLSMTLAATAVQTYIARSIPLHIQGRTFALLGVMKDGMAIMALLLLGVAADLVSVGVVIALSPLLLLALALGIDRVAQRWRRGARL